MDHHINSSRPPALVEPGEYIRAARAFIPSDRQDIVYLGHLPSGMQTLSVFGARVLGLMETWIATVLGAVGLVAEPHLEAMTQHAIAECLGENMLLPWSAPLEVIHLN